MRRGEPHPHIARPSPQPGSVCRVAGDSRRLDAPPAGCAYQVHGARRRSCRGQQRHQTTLISINHQARRMLLHTSGTPRRPCCVADIGLPLCSSSEGQSVEQKASRPHPLDKYMSHHAEHTFYSSTYVLAKTRTSKVCPAIQSQ